MCVGGLAGALRAAVCIGHAGWITCIAAALCVVFRFFLSSVSISVPISMSEFHLATCGAETTKLPLQFPNAEYDQVGGWQLGGSWVVAARTGRRSQTCMAYHCSLCERNVPAIGPHSFIACVSVLHF